MESLPDAFERIARDVLAGEQSFSYRWEAGTDRRRELVFPTQCEGGFEVRVQAETYGLYVFAGGWHNANAAWDANTPKVAFEDLVTDCLGFVRTLLSSDARLDVHLAGGSPYKWVMHYLDNNGPCAEETGLLLFKYWGTRSVQTFQNTVLPPRYHR